MSSRNWECSKIFTSLPFLVIVRTLVRRIFSFNFLIWKEKIRFFASFRMTVWIFGTHLAKIEAVPKFLQAYLSVSFWRKNIKFFTLLRITIWVFLKQSHYSTNLLILNCNFKHYRQKVELLQVFHNLLVHIDCILLHR